MAKKYPLFDPFDRFSDINRFLENFWYNKNFFDFLPDRFYGDYRIPMVDVYEKDNKYNVDIELPGVNKKDILLQIKDNKLEVKVEKKKSLNKEDKKKGIFRYSKEYSGFYHQILLPDNVDTKKVNAKYENGVLKVTMPIKKKPSNNGTRINIK